MKTEVIKISNDGAGMEEALSLTEKLGAEKELDGKSILRLRLLSEELFGMLRSIAGKVEAGYWIENENKSFELHLRSDVKLTDDMKKQFYSASTSGKNDAAKGFMGKLKVMIAEIMMSAGENMPYAMMNTALAYPAAGAATWSMARYKDELKKNTEDTKAKEEWDELEKSIVASIADDVKVKIIGKTAEIIINKTF